MSTLDHSQEIVRELPLTTSSSTHTTIAEDAEQSKTTTHPSAGEKSSFEDQKGDVIHPAPGGPPGVDESAILQGKKLAVVFAAMLLSLLLIALDQTILATALPRIASDFNAFTSQGWVASSFVLTQTSFILFFGQVLRVFPSKYVLLFSITVFEVGSIICGSCQSVDVLIFGRALSGVGAAGIFIAMLQILAQVTLLKDRPRLFGMFGAVFGLSSIIGPLMGGALTDKVTWRWCFYINVPVGAVTLVAVSLLLKASPPLGSNPTKRTYKDIIHQTLHLDWVGGALVLAAITCLVLALQWGGNTKPWNSAAVIVPFVLAGALVPVTIYWEKYRGDSAMVPKAIFKSISIYAIVAFNFMTRYCLLLFTYYIPIYYQAGRGETATQSGVDLLPLMLSVVITVIASGQIVGKVGRYWYFLLCGPTFLITGAALMYTVTEFTSSKNVIGYQILTGVGIGSTMQNSLFAMQAEFRDNPRLLAQATGMASFGQFLGGTIGLAVSQTIFSSELSKKLALYAPQANKALIEQSPTSIYTAIPADQIASVVHAYVAALRLVFIVGVPIGAISIGLALLIKNINIKVETPKGEEAVIGTPADDADSVHQVNQKIDQSEEKSAAV